MLSSEERDRVVVNLRHIAQQPPEWDTSACAIAEVLDVDYPLWQSSGELFDMLADLIDRPKCRDLVEHKPDPFVPGKRMTDGFFYCSSCGWDGRLWEYVGFGDMMAYDAVFCPKCGKEIER